MKKRTIFIACLLALSTTVSAQTKPAVIEAYPLPAVYSASVAFAMQANGKSIPVIQFDKKYDYAHFSVSAGSAALVITLLPGESITSYNISPKKWNIPATVHGNQLTITINKDAYLIVKINAQKELVIAVDAMEKQTPASTGKGIFNITTDKYKADATGKTLSTVALQQAIDDAAAYHNGIVYVPAGVYAVGNIHLKSNMALYLAGGAVLLCSGRAEAFTHNARKRSQNRDITWWISTDSGVNNVKIYGRGTLDGNGRYLTEKENLGNHILAIMHTKRFVLDGIVIQNSGAWAVIPTRSTQVQLRNFKLFNHFDMGENDGIDVMESNDVLVQHGIGIALDDPFSTKTWEQPTDLCRNWPGHPLPQKNIVFDDLVSWTYCYGYKVGQGVMQPQSAISFTNCVVYDAAVGIGIHHKWGTSWVRKIMFDNIIIERLSYQNDDHRTWGVFFLQNGDKKGSGPVSDVTVKNITLHDLGKSPGKIKGVNNDVAISNVTFKNIRLVAENKFAGSLLDMRMTDTLFCREVRVMSR